MPRKTGRISKEQLAQLPEIYLRDNAVKMLESWHANMLKKMEIGDMRAMELIARLFQMDKGPGGITIFNQHLTLNGSGAAGEPAAARVRSFDQIVLKLEEQENAARQNRLLNAPVENSEDDDEMEDAEIEDAEELAPEPVEA